MVVVALGMLVVGVSLIAVPTDAPSRVVTRVEGIHRTASPRPSSGPDLLALAPSPTPSPSAPTSPPAPVTPLVQAGGPAHLHLWQQGVYDITFTVPGTQSAAVWWSGVKMQDWTWSLVDGHAEMTPSSDRLEGTIVGGRAVIELDLTPMRTGQLVIEGSVNGGQPLGLAVVQVS